MSKSFLKLFVSVIKYLYRIQFTYSFVVRFAPNRYMWDDSNMHTHSIINPARIFPRI